MPSLMTRLRTASEGLLYMSESDHPFTPVFWPAELLREGGITPEAIRSLAGIEPARPTAIQDFEAFFKPLVTEEDWYEDADRDLVRRYQRLKDTLLDQLADLRVYRFGRGDVLVFVVGQTADGGIGGLRTRAVEPGSAASS